jgi:bifunctional DNA-binding transcriptional regulator/antitoxin component of YhaV-PrlF toxin-antitoxin module
MTNLITKIPSRIQRVTSKGQITLPAFWRKKTGASTIVVKSKGDLLEISPAKLKSEEVSEYTVFDAIRDNKGKGIKAGDLVKILKKINS